MNDDTEVLADTVRRVRDAYALNGIPWDGSIASKIQRMRQTDAHALAAYWEKRAEEGPKEVWPGDDEPTVEPPPLPLSPIRRAKRIIDSVSGNGALNRPPREGQRAFAAGQYRYHGGCQD